jgi:predicted enzyme related to lactoylglutathione lyase
MSDPFEALRLPVRPTDPDPAFAERLRRRVERSLYLPKGVIVSDIALQSGSSTPATAAGIVPYLIVADGRRAIDWYVSALGATQRGEASIMDDGRLGHAELELHGGSVYLADESPESHSLAPRPGADATVSLVAQVVDVDGAVRRAVAGGASVERAAADNPYGRNAVIRDPFGHRWILSGALPSPGQADSIRPGDIGYVSLWVPDVERASAFFSAVLGWRYQPGSGGSIRMVEGRSISHGLAGGFDRPNLLLCFMVDDIGSALARVHSAGGRAEAPTSAPYGLIANCVDDDGTPFALFQPPAGRAEPRPAINGTRNGDVSYITMEVRDSAQARAFYGSVLGWQFAPGHVEDGWAPADVAPMAGMHGGHALATVVPMYRVDDIHTAVRAVRAEGGRATDPEQQSYGLSAECVDDQGTHFYLGQH